MAKHPTSSRTPRGDEPPEDAFVASIRGAYTWAQENTRALTIVIVAAIVIIGGGLWYIAQQRQVEREAAARLTQVQQTLASGNVQLAVRDLQTFIQRFGSTEAGDQARLLLGGLHLSQDRPQEAVEAVGPLSDDLNESLGLAAARLEAAALEQAGDVDAATRLYLRIADQARFDFEQRQALADAARVHLQHGQPDEAADLFDRVLQTFADDEAQARDYFEMWWAEARAQARAGTGEAGESAVPSRESATGSQPAGAEPADTAAPTETG